MTGTRINTVTAAVAGMLAFLPLYCHAGEQPDKSLYQLQIPAGEYRLQSDPSYQLSAEYRRPIPVAANLVPDAAVIAAHRAAHVAHATALKPFAREIRMAAQQASIDLALVHAVIHIESGYRPEAVSPKGALGLMQVMPGTAARYGVQATRLTVKKNLDVGTRYLRDLMHMFDNRLDLVLAAYNAGEGAVKRYSDRIPPYPETQSYVRAVLAKYAELGGKPMVGEDEPAGAGVRKSRRANPASRRPRI
jgi:soluble lytic murein transglycosylase-like protein